MQCIADNLSLRCSVHVGMRTITGMKVSMRKILKDGEKMYFFPLLFLHYFRKVAPRAQNSALWKPLSLHLVVLLLLIAVPLGWSVGGVLPPLDFQDWLEINIRMESSYRALSQTAASVSSGSEHAPYKVTIVNKLEQIIACIKHVINITSLPFTMNIFPF